MTHFTRCGKCGKKLRAALETGDVCQCEGVNTLLDTGAAYWNYFGLAYELASDILENAGKVERYVNGKRVE